MVHPEKPEIDLYSLLSDSQRFYNHSMNEFWGIIKRFKFKSAFVQFYLNVLLAAFSVSVLFSVFIYNTYISNFSESRSMANSAILTQAVREMDNSVEQLYSTILSLTKDPVITKAVIIPSFDNKEFNSDVVKRLDNTAENFDYINKIYLYESTTDLLFTSDEFIGKKESSKYKRLIDSCLTQRDQVFDSSNRQTGVLLSSNGKLYMVCDFIPSSRKFIGTMVCELNREKLFSILNETTLDTNYLISIEDAARTHLFSSTPASDQKARLQQTMASAYTGWLFELYSSSTEDYSPLSYIRSIFPMLLCALLVSLLISFFVTRVIYSPVRDLMSIIGKDVPNDNPDRMNSDAEANKTSSLPAPAGIRSSEFEILAKTYTRLTEDSKLTEAFLTEVRPDLESRLLLDIISNRSGMTEDAIRSQIDIMNSSLQLHSRYQCFFMRLTPLENKEQLLYYMMFKQIQQQIAGMIRNNLCSLYFLFYNETTFSFLVQYDAGQSTEEISRLRTSLIAAFRQQFSEISDKTITAQGSICNSLTEIGTSYREAREALKKQIYYEGDELSASESSNESRFPKILGQIQQCLDEGDMDQAEQLIPRFLNELCRGANDLHLIRSCCSGLTDVLIERLSVTASSGNPADHAAYQNIYAILDTLGSPEEVHSFMETQAGELLRKLKMEYNRSQHKLISGAKDYIRLHYSDSNLSVRQIADAIGITDTYLSSIFTEYTGENLVSYLNRYRVDMAKELLLNTQIIIKDVGFKTGFYTVQNFNRVFKRFEGMTPGDFRKQNFKK